MFKRKMWLILAMVFLMFSFFSFNKIFAACCYPEPDSYSWCDDTESDVKGCCSCKHTESSGTVFLENKYGCKPDYEPYCDYAATGGVADMCFCRTVEEETDREETLSKGNTYQSDSVEEARIGNSSLCTTDNETLGTNTALGCIPITMGEFVPWLLKGLFGIAGGIAFLLMVYGFILIATSGGDEKKVAGAKETITSALIGLLVCIFSIFILRLITVNILKIPGIN